MGAISKENIPNAYKEVNEILKHIGEEERDLIPENFYSIIKAKMNNDYNYYYDETKEFKDHEMLPETRAILGHIYLKYWADERERSIIERKLKNDIKHIEEEKREKYNPDKIFKSIEENKLENKAGELQQEVQALIKVKESFLTRIINKIKKFFRKKR